MRPTIAALFLVTLFSTSAFAEAPTEEELYKQLLQGPEQVKALESVLKAPNNYSALILYAAAGIAFKEKRLEDAAFLFYAGQLRARFDKECFPPKGTGGNSPFILYSALSQRVGSLINPAVMAEPKAFAKAIDRVKDWTPSAPKEYNPGYEFTARKSEADAHEAAQPNRTEFLSRMGDLADLLNDPEYFAAFRTLQTFNLATAENQRPTVEAKDKATETMKRIQKEKGLKGFIKE